VQPPASPLPNPRPQGFPSRPLADPSAIEVTADVTNPGTPPSQVPGKLAASTLTAGVLLNDRYRVVSVLGRGGMGEVWRADDLVLGTSVALKFLPPSFCADPVRLERFRSEVRLARQIAHPNVCRVYDIGEVAGVGQSGAGTPVVFLSMEFVDGEDLGSLLRRIGRLPTEKAVEVARQICLGLAAAHEQGVIHRDLKPANVMIDGRGRVRLMDFGLAVGGIDEAGGVGGSDAAAGTPLYMAPEQFAGQAATRRSDIYALGLVLYELFTGRAAHAPGGRVTMGDLRRLHESGLTPASMSSVVAEIDPAVERAILRCLERDPEARPGSAIAVAAALPGGDPLAAMLAAGETPSPEMLARVGGEHAGWSPARTWGSVAACAVGLVLVLMLMAGRSILTAVPLDLPPDALRVKAREALAALGYERPQRYSASGFTAGTGYLAFLGRLRPQAREGGEDRAADIRARLERNSPAAMWYWYREAPTPIEPVAAFQRRVDIADPPAIMAGSAMVALDTAGRLVALEVVPRSWRADPPGESRDPSADAPGVAAGPAEPDQPATRPETAEPDWSVLFALAGLKREVFAEAAPLRTSWYASDRRAAWEGVFPGAPDLPLRIEAASFEGRPVSFRLIGPWFTPERTPREGPIGLAARLYGMLDTALFASLMGFSVVLCWRNLRAGRGDRRGATRLAAVMLALGWIASAFSVGSLGSLLSIDGMFRRPVAAGLWPAAITWMLYVALEPAVRRLWPTMLVGWVRVLEGRLGDARVRAEVLTGSLAGVGVALVAHGLPHLLFEASDPVTTGGLAGLIGPRFALGESAARLANAVYIGVAIAFLLAGFRALLRSERWAMVCVGVLVTTLISLESWPDPNVAVLGVVLAGTLVSLLRWSGLVATVVAIAVERVITDAPPLRDPGAWYLGTTVLLALLALAPAVAVAIAGPRTVNR